MSVRYSRGQTMIETVFFLPIILLALFAIIYFSRIGLVNERTQLSLRYAGISAFYNNSAPSGEAYSAANIYSALFQGGATAQTSQPSIGSVSACPTPPTGIFSNSTPYERTTTSAPWWQPDSFPGPPTCNATVVNLPGASFLPLYVAATEPQVSASVSVPSYLQTLLGTALGTVTAKEDFAHAAWPGIILACSSKVYNRTYSALTAEGFATPPPTPPPTPTPLPSPGASPPATAPCD